MNIVVSKDELQLIIDSIACKSMYIKGEIGTKLKFDAVGNRIPPTLSIEQMELAVALDKLQNRLTLDNGNNRNFVAT